MPVPCGDREFFLDLLFYHCQLHRYVVFDLKLGRFEPEYVGKLNFYVQRRLPAKVRRALPTAEDLRPTVTRTRVAIVIDASVVIRLPGTQVRLGGFYGAGAAGSVRWRHDR